NAFSVGITGSENVFYSDPGASCPSGYTCDSGNNVAYNSPYTPGANFYTSPTFTNPTDLLANRMGQPNCSGYADVAACMGWRYGTQTATNLSVISDLTPTAGGVSGKDYQPPRACAPDSLWPSWLKGIVYLAWDGANLTEQPGLVNKPCLM